MVTSYDINVVYIQIVVYKYGYTYVSHCCLPTKLKYALSNLCEISLITVNLYRKILLTITLMECMKAYSTLSHVLEEENLLGY